MVEKVITGLRYRFDSRDHVWVLPRPGPADPLPKNDATWNRFTENVQLWQWVIVARLICHSCDLLLSVLQGYIKLPMVWLNSYTMSECANMCVQLTKAKSCSKSEQWGPARNLKEETAPVVNMPESWHRPAAQWMTTCATCATQKPAFMCFLTVLLTSHRSGQRLF